MANGFWSVAQWDWPAATAWSLISLTYIQSDQDVLAPLVTEDAQAFAAESGIEPRLLNAALKQGRGGMCLPRPIPTPPSEKRTPCLDANPQNARTPQVSEEPLP